MIELPRATPEDADAIAALHVASWRAAYTAELPPEFLAGVDVTKRAVAWRDRILEGKIVLVERHDGALLGFCACGPSRDADADPARVWEIQALHVSPSLRRTGIGTRLFAGAVDLAIVRGAHELTLWVVKTNSPARRFYERHGMRPDGAAQVHRLATDAILDEVRYRLELPPINSRRTGGC